MHETTAPCFDPTAEYETLREELLQSRRYVFERPVFIAGLAIAATNEQAFLTAYPPIIAALLLFNFWFTVNRLLSSARIVSYIQIALEEGAPGAWRGWETSLREYRTWLRTDVEKKKAMLDEEVSRSSARDALTYYPAILALHVFLIAGAAAGSLAAAIVRRETVSLASAALTLIFVGLFATLAVKWQPSTMSATIERNRIIWTRVLEADEGHGV